MCTLLVSNDIFKCQRLLLTLLTLIFVTIEHPYALSVIILYTTKKKIFFTLLLNAYGRISKWYSTHRVYQKIISDTHDKWLSHECDCHSHFSPGAGSLVEYFFRGPLGTLGFFYAFWVAESEFREYQVETLFNYLLLTFFINKINIIFSIFKNYQTILCYFLNKNGPCQLFPSLKNSEFLNLWEFFSRKLSVGEKSL